MMKRKVKLPEIMLFIVAAIVPIIVRTAAVLTPPEFMSLHRDEFRVDVFSYHKAWVLCVCALLIVLHWISDLIIKSPSTVSSGGTGSSDGTGPSGGTGCAVIGYEGGGIKQYILALIKDPIIVMTGVYVLFVLLSNIASDYTHTALWGVYDRREGLFVQLAYMTVFLASLFYVRIYGLSSARVMIIGLMFSSIVMGAIGFSQFINRDFFTTNFAGWIVSGVWHQMTPRFVMSYGTNFNPNTFGLVTAMLFPVMFGAAASVWSSRKHKVDQLIFGGFVLAGVLMAVGVVGSRSVGGFVGASVAVFATLTTLCTRSLVQRKANQQKTILTQQTKTLEQQDGTNRIGSSSRILKITGASLVVITLSGFILWGYFYDDLTFTMGRIAAVFEPPDMSHLPEFEFEGNRMSVTERGTTYHVTFPITPGAPEVVIDGFAVPYIREQDGTNPASYIFDVFGHGDLIFSLHENIYLYHNRQMMITIHENRLYLMHVNGSLVDPTEPIPSFGFEGWETWGSNRGHIFSRTIPLLRDNILIGRGSDTFLLLFPTHDMIGNLRYHGNTNMLVDKAHNLYLQTAVTTGMVSALALIAIFGYYILTTFWSIVRHSNNEPKTTFWLRLGILASVSAFSVSSLSTDSTVSSTPMFWIIIGIGFALNTLHSGRNVKADRLPMNSGRNVKADRLPMNSGRNVKADRLPMNSGRNVKPDRPSVGS